jgi:hypothetical protein
MGSIYTRVHQRNIPAHRVIERLIDIAVYRYVGSIDLKPIRGTFQYTGWLMD